MAESYEYELDRLVALAASANLHGMRDGGVDLLGVFLMPGGVGMRLGGGDTSLPVLDTLRWVSVLLEPFGDFSFLVVRWPWSVCCFAATSLAALDLLRCVLPRPKSLLLEPLGDFSFLVVRWPWSVCCSAATSLAVSDLLCCLLPRPWSVCCFGVVDLGAAGSLDTALAFEVDWHVFEIVPSYVILCSLLDWS